ncbi:MAG: cell surface protein SprA [Chitinivibrionales bacterium]
MADGLRSEPPAIDFYHPLSEGEPPPSMLSQKRPAGLTLKTQLIEERQVIDFESRAVSFERVEKNFGIVIWEYRYDEMDAYISSRERFAFADLWYANTLSLLRMSNDKKKQFNIFQMELPVQYPGWAQRILGKDPPKLSITGYEKIEVSYEYTKMDVVGSNLQTNGTGGPKFNQENQFTVNGSVGRLINVNIKSSTNQMNNDVNDPFKDFKVEYKGEGNELEDEVIQQVSAGYIGFSMPGTSLSGYSNSHEGLIGIEVKSKIGPLELTTIASQEHGESQKASFDLTAGGGGVTTVTEKDFVRNKMFFLDTAYLSMYLGKRTSAPSIKTLNVYINTSKTMSEFSSTQKSTSTFYSTTVNGTKDVVLKLLVRERDYTIDKQINGGLGCIRFLDSLQVQDADNIGIYMVTSDPSIIPTKGDTSHTTTSSGANNLTIASNMATPIDSIWILKPATTTADDPKFKLMFKNVYALPNEIDPTKFQIKVKRIPGSGGDTVDNLGGKLFSSSLGLVDQNGSAKITSTQIFDIADKLLIMPAFPDTAVGNKPFLNPALGANNTNSAIYDTTGDLFNEIKPLYNISMTGSTRKSSFQLGTGSIIAGTVKVKGDGQDLQQDTDFVVDYQFGTLQLTSKRALAKNHIDVTYQSEALFVPKSKVFLGAHGEMKLPFGLNSFMGASILYQNAASNDAIPKIGQEPYSKVLLDMNAKMDFEPQWMSDVVNMIPLLSSDAKSTASFNVEIAHSLTNPNTDGNAYIDDFESSSKPYTIGKWYQAAPPGYLCTLYPDNQMDSLLKCPPAWLSYWYQPQGNDRLLIDSIHAKPSIITSSADQNYEQDMLIFTCLPAPNNIALNLNPNVPIKKNPLADEPTHQFMHPWAGIMYPFPLSSIDRTKDKYFEFWARGLDGGRLYVDMGEVSEDICLEGGPPDGLLNDEDTAHLGGAGAVNSAEDVGLDGLPDASEFYLYPVLDSMKWDTLRQGNSWLPFPLDPAHDNFQTYGDQTSYQYNFPFVNGTEKDAMLTSKDLNGDGLATGANENYFRRFVDFDSLVNPHFMARNDSNYMVSDSVSGAAAGHGWHLYRVPLNDTIVGQFTKFGSPRWDRIKYIRLFWTNFNPAKKQTLNTIQFAGMQVVRNEWQEAPAISNDSTQRIIKMLSSSINTYDNPNYRSDPPPGIPVTKDDLGNTVKETSLRVNFTDVRPGESALVKDILVGQVINIASYQTISMLVHSDETYGPDVSFFFRFGADDSTYYEYGARPYSGWVANTMNINLHELAKWKEGLLSTNGAILDSAMDTTRSFGAYSFGLKYHNSSPPNFSNISWMAIGIKRARTGAVDGITGEMWFDELKVGGVHQFNGWAGQASLTTSWAGFMNLAGALNYRDGNFQEMTETQMNLGTSTLSENYSASWALGRFLPAKWGVNVPIGTSVSGSISRPSLVPNTDEYLTDRNNNPDDISDMYHDAISLITGGHSQDNTDARHYQTTNVSKSFYTSYDKGSTSKDPIVNILLERLSLDYKSSYSLTQSAKGSKTFDNDTDVIDSLTATDYNGGIKYDLSPKPAPDWTKWKPFGKLKLQWLPDRIKNYELSLLPSVINFNVANIDYHVTEDHKMSQNTAVSTKNLSLSHGTNFAWDPINILNLNYSLNVNRNLDNFVSDPNWGSLSGWNSRSGSFALSSRSPKWDEFMHQITKFDNTWGRYYVLNGERDRSQTSAIKLDPTIWDWLTMSTDYSANYKQTAASLSGDSAHYENMEVDSKYHLTTTLSLPAMFKNLSAALPNAKTAKEVFSSIEKALNKISLNSFSFNYDASMSLLNNNMDTNYLNNHITPFGMLEYQLGVKGRSPKDILTGNMDDNKFGGMNSRNGDISQVNAQPLNTLDKRTSTRSFSVNTGLNLPEPVSISIGTLGLKWSKSYSAQPDPSTKDSTLIFPDIDVSGSTQLLNKIKLVNRYLQAVSLSSSYNYQYKLTKTYTPNSYDSIATTTYRFAPFIGLDGKLKKWPVNLTYSHTWNSSSETKLSAGTTQTIEHDNKLGATYELQKSANVSEFRLLFWTIPLKGTFSLGLDGEQGTTTTITSTAATAPQTVVASSFSIGPHSSYTFSDNITGEAHISYSNKKDQSQSTTSFIFALSATVNLK